MEYYSTLAFVLKQEPIKEHNRRYIFFTQEFGKLSLLALGARKINAKLAGHLEIPTLTQIHFTMSHNPRLITALEEIPYLGIKKKEKALTIAFWIADLVNELVIEKQSDADIWKLLFDTFYFLEKNLNKFPETADFTWIYFNAQFLKILGFSPFLDGCIECGSKTNNKFFSFERKGIVCQLHHDKNDWPINSQQRKFLIFLFNSTFRDFSQVILVREILKEKKYLQKFLNKFTLVIKSDIM
ncbi:MAG: DNA repair protein RecO [Candidatus Pacebacteria bacterium]|nr:DNA repair protein RecO [Candidatus Paceibacterota bacterium]